MVVEIRPHDHILNSLHDHSLDRQQRGLISEIWVCLQLKNHCSKFRCTLRKMLLTVNSVTESQKFS